MDVLNGLSDSNVSAIVNSIFTDTQITTVDGRNSKQ